MFSRSHFVWNEPWFFVWRIRSWQAWCVVAVFLLIVALLMAAAFVFLAAQRPGWLEVIGLSALVAAIAWVILDGPNWRRRATLDAKSLSVLGDLGSYSQQQDYRVDQIKGVVIRQAHELEWPFPALFLFEGEKGSPVLEGEVPEVIGIDRGISLNRLASALHEIGIPVELNGWNPQAESEFERTFQIEAADLAAVQPTGRIDPLPPGTPKLWTPIGITIAIIQQCWAGAIALTVIGAAGYYIYAHWANLGLIQVVLSIGIPIAFLYIAGIYTDRLATASTSKTLLKDGKAQIHRRSDVKLNIDSSDIHPVEVLEEDQFAKTIQRIHELGFVEVDLQQRELRFEGKQQRWQLPASCIRRLSIEEVQSGADGDQQAGHKNYYIVVEFDSPGEKQKFGLRSAKRDYGEFNDIKRAEQAIELFEYLAPLL